MLVVTHEMSFARTVSNKVVFMENGLVVESGDSKSFFAHPKEERTKNFIRTILGVGIAEEEPRWQKVSCFA